jgi:hypothetical protein
VLVSRPAWLSSPRSWPKPPADADPAVLQYFYGPAMADADHAVRVAYEKCQELWKRGAKIVVSFFGTDNLMVTWPLGIGGAIGIAAGTAFGAFATVACALMHLLVVGVSALSVRATGAVLRGTDSAVLRIKNIQMICPVCYERVSYPAYDCPGLTCPNRHRDVRPGRFGIVRRRCYCGTRMKTLLLFGSSEMDARCPHCGHPLEYHPGEAPEMVLPFFGAVGAGKTRLLFSMVTQLRMWTAAERLAAEFGDSSTARDLNVADHILRSNSTTAKTPIQLPRGHVIRVTSGNDTRILHMFDAPGERFYKAHRTQELRYFSQARTLILVIDPLSVEAFWERLPRDRQAELDSLRSTAPSPTLAYDQTHQEIERMGVPLGKARLAVVFSRADLIDEPSDDVATWADEVLGLGNLVCSARQQFKEAYFFHTAAVMVDGTVHESVPKLLRWVLAGSGVSLPGGTP